MLGLLKSNIYYMRKNGIRLSKYLFPVFLSLLFLFSCKKRNEFNPCLSIQLPSANFNIFEQVGDTIFTSDTIFRDNPLKIKATESFESYSWKVGDDPRTFSNAEFDITFYTSLVSIPITLTGTKKANRVCFPSDQGVYSATKQLTTVEQFDKNILTLSPLIGNYRGFFSDNPNDIFTIQFQYFDSTKYDVMLTGSKNFYYLSNFPKGFTNTSTPGFLYPELSKGVQPEMGFKSFVFDYSNTKGRGWLNKDSLYINYVNYNTPLTRKTFIGVKVK